MRKLNKLLILIVAPLAMLLVTIIKLPDIEAILRQTVFEHPEDNSKKDSEDNNSSEEKEKQKEGWLTYMVIAEGVIIFSTLFTYYVTMYSPYSRYEALAKKRWYIFDKEAEALLLSYSPHNLNINIMVPVRRFFYFIEPKINNPGKRKFTFTGLVFKVIWSYNEPVNKRFKMTVNQGHAGEVYRDSRRLLGLDLTRKVSPIYNFTLQQTALLQDLKMVISCPVIYRKSYADSQKVKILGVLNIEGTNKGSEKLLSSVSLYVQALALSRLSASLLER